jgi:sulfite dehydrogenase
MGTADRSPANPQRRNLLAGGATAVAAAGLAGFSKTAIAQAAAAAKPLPPYVAWKDPNALIVHTSSTLETKRTALGTSIITPTDQLYIRNNLPAPDASIVTDRDSWEVTVEGVKNPRELTMKELKGMGLETTAMVLKCPWTAARRGGKRSSSALISAGMHGGSSCWR